MLKCQFFVISFLIGMYQPVFAQKGGDPVFDLGKGESAFGWGTKLPNLQEQSDFRLRVGLRLQGVAENRVQRELGGIDAAESQDMYLRRSRLQLEAGFQKDYLIYMDIRADEVDRGSTQDNSFALGDAFFQIKDLFNSDIFKLRVFRAKYDVSRSQTVSSSRLLILNRANISDYSADYISEARRGTNIQLLANWQNKVRAQWVVGDSVHSNSFLDSLERTPLSIEGQSFAYGTRLRLSPIPGWEEEKMTETKFGHGKHFTIGAGAFFVDNIRFSTNTLDSEVDRRLYNYELSFHYGPISFASEYYIFEGMVKDFSAATLETGKSSGWFAQLEYTFTNFHYIAPFVRLQKWDRFSETSDFDQNSWAGGLNYYLKGNKLRLGAFVENTEFSKNLAATNVFPESESLVNLNFLIHY